MALAGLCAGRPMDETPHKWFDIEAMSRAALPVTCAIERVNCYTAHISGRVGPGAPRRALHSVSA